MNRITQAIIESKTIPENAYIIVGFSGGPDSLTLLHALNSVSVDWNWTIFPVHINHKLRPGKCDDEQKHAEELCKSMGLKCYSYEIDCREKAKEDGISEEEEGRAIRYKIFSSFAERIEKNGIKRKNIRIAIAQNSDDQVETVIFRMLRGTGLRGLGGIRKERTDNKGYMIVRPILSISRNSIEDYIALNHLEPNYDESNEETEYSRNKIRLELLPYLEKQYNTNLRQGILRIADIATCDNNFLEETAFRAVKNWSEKAGKNELFAIDVKSFSNTHKAIQRQGLALILRQIGLNKKISFSLIEELIEITISEKPSAELNLPGEIIAQREYGKLIFRSKKVHLQNKEGKTGIPELHISTLSVEKYRAEKNKNSEKMYAVFDKEKLEEVYPDGINNIVLRQRQSGDWISIGKGRKKIQDVFIDDKIPCSLRKEIYLAAIGSEVLWIVPNKMMTSERYRKKGKYSQNYQMSNNTNGLLFLEITYSL